MILRRISPFCGLFCLIGACWALSGEIESEYPLVEAVSGGHAALPCNVSAPVSADEATLVLWYRQDLPNPIYTLDVRGGVRRHFPSSPIEGRADFDLDARPPALLIREVSRDDEADYRCRVDLRRSRTLILHSRLKVIEPPSEPIIMDEHGQRLHDTVGPFDEGSTIVFICEVDGGDPSPNVTWWRGGVLFDDSFAVIRQRFVRNELVLRDLPRSELMVEYTCKASNTPLDKPMTSTVRLDMNLLPTDTKITRTPPLLLAGEEQEFTCETRGSRPRALTTWWLEGLKLTAGVAERETANVTRSTLHLTPLPEDNGKRLVCKSANPSMPKTTFEDERLLRVQFVPIVKLMLGMGLTNKEIKEGSEVYLECNIFSNPWIFEIAWQYEDRPLDTNVTFGVVISNQTLIIRNVRKDHKGRYRCTANNALGRGYSEYLNLLVQFVPVCKHRHHRIQGLSLLESVNVSCDVEADPHRDLLYRWSLLDSGGLEQPLSEWSPGGGVYSYVPLTEGGYGTLLCWGRNAAGEQREPCAVRIVPAGAPDPPHDCLITNQTSSSLTVECAEGYNGSLPQLFHAEVYDSVAEHMAHNATSRGARFRVEGLTPATAYVIVVYASNAKGRSNSAALVASTLSPAERRTANTEEANFSPAVGILIAVVILLFIFTIIIMIVIKLHSTKKTPTKDAVITETPNEDMPKKEIEDCQEGGSSKGPDIIPLSIDPDVFFTGRVPPDETLYRRQNDISSTEYVHEKYTHTVL